MIVMMMVFVHLHRCDSDDDGRRSIVMAAIIMVVVLETQGTEGKKEGKGEQ